MSRHAAALTALPELTEDHMGRRLVITRGLPAAGKTTRALKWVAEHPEGRARVGSDQIAEMLHPHAMLNNGAAYSLLYAEREQLAVNTLIETLLNSGLDVVCDDPFLLPHYLDEIRVVADRCEAELEIWDMTDVPLDVCIERDRQRGRDGGHSVGEEAIRAQYRQFCDAQLLVVDSTVGRRAENVREQGAKVLPAGS
ncbi:ATP-binding protein [Actinoplanes sp. NPDC049316]|uniref:ATP-binding protein n=1 Tax=Actinoplanes sp. NPDC049316 TaxID=3154727 RepID=UPI003445CC59